MSGAADKAQEARDAFHSHLDGCRQCRDQPFNLCMTGARLIEEAGKLSAAALAPPLFIPPEKS